MYTGQPDDRQIKGVWELNIVGYGGYFNKIMFFLGEGGDRHMRKQHQRDG